MSIAPDASPSPEEIRLLIRDKYDGAAPQSLEKDLARLRSGEPLAYVIGWVPFLSLKIGLSSKPLIPRPETEWWTEALIERLKERFGDEPFSLLDLCAGSGAIGLAVLARFPAASVTFIELEEEHAALIGRNLEENGLDASRASIYAGDLFSALPAEARFGCIATNPPYVPEGRILEESVTAFEPARALYAGEDGLALIRRIAQEAPGHLDEGAELWLECDSDHAEAASALIRAGGAEKALVRTDPYGRERLCVGYYR